MGKEFEEKKKDIQVYAEPNHFAIYLKLTWRTKYALI